GTAPRAPERVSRFLVLPRQPLVRALRAHARARTGPPGGADLSRDLGAAPARGGLLRLRREDARDGARRGLAGGRRDRRPAAGGRARGPVRFSPSRSRDAAARGRRRPPRALGPRPPARPPVRPAGLARPRPRPRDGRAAVSDARPA